MIYSVQSDNALQLKRRGAQAKVGHHQQPWRPALA